MKVALLGAGNRGQIYSDYALAKPEEMEIVTVIDINPFKKNEAGDRYGVPQEMRFDSLDAFLAVQPSCDFVINATMDQQHYETAMRLIGAGYNLVMEKPITGNLQELRDIENLAKEKGVKVLVCHVLRYTPFYRKIKEIVDSGEIGKIVSLQMNEHVWYGHFVNAYVRGKWRSEKECGSGFLLAKCCHDTDLICWLNNIAKPTKVHSFGSRSFYTESNAPKGAKQYCFECPHKGECVFDAYKFELEKDFIPDYTWARLNKPLAEISREEKETFLKTDVYGQCVYKIRDMDIVDRQCVSVEFDNGSIATLNMITGASGGRNIHVIGEYGEIIGHLNENKLYVNLFDKQNLDFYDKYIDCTEEESNGENSAVKGHFGGDYNLMKEAVRYFNGESASVSVTKIDDSINGHLVVYAAERSRKTATVVEIQSL